MIIIERFGGLVKDRGEFRRSGLRYQLPLFISTVGAEYQGASDPESSVFISSRVPISMIWDMDKMYVAMKGPRRYSGAVCIIELDDFIQEFDTCCDMQFLRNATLFTPFFAWKELIQHSE